MSDYAERAKVRALIRQNNIAESRFVIGAGETYSKKKRRFEFHATNRPEILNRTAQYAVKYFSAYDFYLVWEVAGQSKNKSCRRTVFSAAYDDVMKACETKRPLIKGVEYPWWGEERVMVLSLSELETFITTL